MFLVATASASAKTTLRVCAGSSCAGRCVGSFEPVSAFQAYAKAPCSRADVEIETVFCMNMCKRGPNVRLIHEGELATVPSEMGETELSRKAFQGVRSDEKVFKVWSLASCAAAGSLDERLALHGSPPVDLE
jgi:hypothetical protein